MLEGILSWGDMIRIMKNSDFYIWFECPHVIDKRQTPATYFTARCNFFYFLPNPSAIPFANWPKSREFCSELNGLCDRVLRYTRGYQEPRMKSILENIFWLPIWFDWEHTDIPSLYWFYFLKLHSDKFQIDIRKGWIRLKMECEMKSPERPVVESEDSAEEDIGSFSIDAIRQMMLNPTAEPPRTENAPMEQDPIPEHSAQSEEQAEFKIVYIYIKLGCTFFYNAVFLQ